MLRLAHNRLAMLPSSIGGLTGLKSLFLDFNRWALLTMATLTTYYGDTTYDGHTTYYCYSYYLPWLH